MTCAAERSGVDAPLYRAVWEDDFPGELLAAEPPAPSDFPAFARSLAVVREHRDRQTLWDDSGRVREQVLAELGTAGYWGLLVPRPFGGSGVPLGDFARFLTRMAATEPAVAALATAHSCLGAVTALQRFGTRQQQQRWLPDLAAGRQLSAFALTEPGAGSDLASIRSRAERDGDHCRLWGEKIFVTNLAPGRLIVLVCRLDGQPAAWICPLPEREDETIRWRNYGLYALRRCRNAGVEFRGFRLPSANLLPSPGGGGLAIVYHGLNRARACLCASAAGSLRMMLASLVPWTRHRVTQGQPLVARPLVQRRLARLAGLIVGCDALAAWAAGLLQRGYRGEGECIIAKTFAADALREASVDVLMKTHGGRAFLHGHLFGDRLYDYLAPSIYEGESELLGLALVNGLVKHQGQIAASAAAEPRLPAPAALPSELAGPADRARRELSRGADALRRMLHRHGSQWSQQQLLISAIATRIQAAVVTLCVCQHAARQDDPTVRLAAGVLCQELALKQTGRIPSERYARQVGSLAQAIEAGDFTPIADLPQGEILLPYPASPHAPPH